MKRILLFVFLLPFGLSVQSQSIDNDVVATAGTHFDNVCGVKLSWTLGEAVTSTVNDGSWIITQGFHQPWGQGVVAVEDPKPAQVSLHVYPNPMDNELLVTIDDNKDQLVFSLYDISGRLIHQKEISPDQLTLDLPVQWLAAGSYLLQVNSNDNQFQKTYQLQKMR